MKIQISDLTPTSQPLHANEQKAILGGRFNSIELSTQLTVTPSNTGGDIGIGGSGTTYQGGLPGDKERPTQTGGDFFPQQEK